MNITKKKRLGAVVLAAAIATAAGSLVATPAFAAGPTSLGPVWIVSTDDGSALTNPINWRVGSVGLAATQTVSDFKSHFVLPAGTTKAIDYIATPGTEDNIAGYLGTSAGDPSFVTFQAPDTLSKNPNLPDFHQTLNTTGGTFSLGVAYTNNAGTFLGSYFTAVTITGGGSSDMTYVPPAAGSAPVITTQPSSTSVVAGSNATFTAAATGADSVKWQVAPSASTSFTDVSGATSATLTVTNAQAAQAGNQYRAVFTNSTGSTTTNVAVLTVTAAVPTQPSGTDPGKQTAVTGTSAVPYGGPLSVTGLTVPDGSYAVYAWSNPTALPNTTVTGGAATINVSTLPAGNHTIALVTPNTTTVVGWFTITIQPPANTGVYNLNVPVTTTNTFALQGAFTTVNFPSAARGATTEADVSPMTVIDDRNLLPGWNLTSSVADFVNASANNDVIAKSALNILPQKVGGTLPLININSAYDGDASHLFAEGLANSSTPAAGTQFGAHLKFTVPSTAKVGTYTSTLTFTLTTKP